MSTEQLTPMIIDYPANAYGASLPTDGAPSPTTQEVSTAPEIAQIVAQGGLVNSQAQLVTIPTQINCCFRDAVLTGLISTQPFVGFLEHWASLIAMNTPKLNGDSARDFIIKGLQGLADEFHQPWADVKEKRKSLDKMASNFHQGWNDFGDRDITAQEDAPLYLQALLQNLDPQQQTDYVLDNIFRPLFCSEFVGRNAFECACKTKSREPKHRIDDDRFVLSVSITPETPTLVAAIGNSLYDRQGERKAKCPTCGNEATEHRYLKFRYLPEVLFVQLEYPTKGAKGQITRDSKLRCALPDEIDFDLLHDKIDRSKGNDETDAAARREAQRSLPNTAGESVNIAKDNQYKLQFVIDYAGSAGARTSGGHYRCNIRRPDNSWALFDGIKRDINVPTTTLQAIESHKVFQPRLIAYVRRHNATPDADAKGAQVSECEPTTSPVRPKTARKQPSMPSPVTQQPTAEAVPNVTTSDPDYDNWDASKLKAEIALRGMALPRKKNDGTLRAVLQQHDKDPKDYDLYTAKHLNSMVAQRNLGTKGKKQPTKRELIKILTDHDHTTRPGSKRKSLPGSVAATAPPEEGQVEQSTTFDAQQDLFKAIMKHLQPVLEPYDKMLKEFNELKQQLKQQLLQLQQPLPPQQQQAPSQSERSKDAPSPSSTTPLQETQPQLMASITETKSLEDKCSQLEKDLKQPAVPSGGNLCLSVSVRVMGTTIDGQANVEAFRQYLVPIQGEPPKDGSFPTADLRTRTESGGLLVLVDVNVPGNATVGGVQQHVIKIPVPDLADTKGLRMSTVLDIIKLNGPFLIRQLDVSTPAVSVHQEAKSSSKRGHDAIADDDASGTGEPPLKKQKP